jgi:hypothetical protein
MDKRLEISDNLSQEEKAFFETLFAKSEHWVKLGNTPPVDDFVESVCNPGHTAVRVTWCIQWPDAPQFFGWTLVSKKVIAHDPNLMAADLWLEIVSRAIEDAKRQGISIDEEALGRLATIARSSPTALLD